MQEKEPSRTALGAAAHRAAHQILDQGRIFADPLAVTLLGEMAELAAEQARAHPSTRGLRLFIAARSQIAETHLAAGVETRGVRQLVVLGAGLDTYAYRNPFADQLRVFEVDHPATQAWKRRRLSETGITAPLNLAYVAVDFERDSLLERLVAEGFDPSQRAFFTWLGVVPYLTKEAITATLGLIGGLRGGGEVVFDYSDPPATLPPDARKAHLERAAGVAARGEPFLSYFEPAQLHAQLLRLGFSEITDLGPQALITRYFWPGASTPNHRARGGHIISAATPSRA